MGFLLHIIGLYKIINYGDYVGGLYGYPLLNYHYDLIVHSVGMFFFSLAFCSVFYNYFKEGFKSTWLVFIMVLFIMFGIGAFNETLEYVGYDILGYGDGFLEFGEGDSSSIDGPWENASLDMLANLFGSMLAISIFIAKQELY